MKRTVISFLCICALMLGCVPLAGALEGESLRASDTLATLGLVQGTSDGDYDLDAPATRAQAAVLLVRLAGAQADAAADPWFAGFRDVPAWAADAVDYAAHQGWVTGVSETSFNAAGNIDAGDWFASLLRMLGYEEGRDFTLADATSFAWRAGLTTRPCDGPMSRGQLFLSMQDALNFPYRDGSETVVERLIRLGLTSRSAANALGLLDTTLSARQLADRSLSSVFKLVTYTTQESVDNNDPDFDGSGFFISADGLAVTNYHVIHGAIEAVAVTQDGQRFPVERVLYYDAGVDVAVVKISTLSESHVRSAFPPLTMAPSGSADVRSGDIVYAIGSPLGQGLSVSSGVVSDPARGISPYTLPCILNTADTSQGSSGGALFNEYGQVIGITSGAYRDGNGMYLAVPIEAVLTADLTGEGQTLREVRSIMYVEPEEPPLA